MPLGLSSSSTPSTGSPRRARATRTSVVRVFGLGALGRPVADRPIDQTIELEAFFHALVMHEVQARYGVNGEPLEQQVMQVTGRGVEPARGGLRFAADHREVHLRVRVVG